MTSIRRWIAYFALGLPLILLVAFYAVGVGHDSQCTDMNLLYQKSSTVSGPKEPWSVVNAGQIVHVPHEPGTPEYSEQRANYAYPPWLRWNSVRQSAITAYCWAFASRGSAVLAAGIYAVFAVYQWAAIRRQAEITASLHTPKVFLLGIRLESSTYHRAGEPHTERFVTVELKNYGWTPAFVTTRSIGFSLNPVLPSKPVFTNIEMRPPGEVIMPDDTYAWRRNITEQISAEDLRASSKDGSGRIWFYGYVGFRDVFNREHQTGFCTRRDATTHGANVIDGPSRYIYNT